MHSKRRYKLVSQYLAIPGELESFRDYEEFGIIFPKILDAIYRIMKEIIFQIPSFITFLNPKIVGFLFIYEK